MPVAYSDLLQQQSAGNNLGWKGSTNCSSSRWSEMDTLAAILFKSFAMVGL
jgi:hypothetical protein